MDAKLTFAHYGEERDLNLTDDEKELAGIALKALEDAGVDGLSLVRKSDSYATIVADHPYEHDLLRFKVTTRAKWVSVPMSNEDASAYADSPLFAAQKNKRQFMWKAKIATPQDVLQFVPFVLRAYPNGKEV